MTNDEVLQIIDRAAKSGVAELELGGKDLTLLPSEIGKLSNLTSLRIKYSHLTSLPESIGQLSNLVTLDLDDNRLAILPNAIGQLKKLKTLSLHSNRLLSLPETIGQLKNLTMINLNFNKVISLPESIGQLSHLMALDLSDNDLTSLPESIGQLSNLATLDLHSNQLTTFPRMIAQLSNLTLLDLRFTGLTYLPQSIAQLTKLKALYLSHNQLTSLPPDIRNLSKLEELDLTYNSGLPIPPEILGTDWNNLGDPTTILNYYFQLQRQPNRPLNEAKVLLVGEGDVGKTSLLRKLLGQPFDRHQAKTHGITIERWEVEVNNQPVKLNLWDFGGQEIMHATHQFFLSKRSLYLLVIDCRQSETQNQIEYWLQIITSFGGDSPIILVGNQCDHQPLDLDQRGLKDKYPNLHTILETSCQEDQGIDTLKATITQALSQIPELHQPLPATWFTVKEQLEQRTQDFLSRQDYEQVCTQADIPDSQSQSDLLQLLHNLGIVLNFQDDIRLSPEFADTNVLKPSWITNGVYKILNHSELFTVHHGILNQSHLPTILHADRYPRNKYSFLIGIMRKFDLCFDLDGHANQQFLIPGLLPKEELYTGEWQGSLTFQYHYNVLPPSIISRFIVRMNSKINQRTYWRSGVVLKERENTALIRGDREDKRITIQVKGNPSTRRNFLSAIRSQFDEIHKTIPGLGITEYLLYQENPPILLDYEDLISAEEAGEQTYFIGKLKRRIDLGELLDGVEARPSRRQHSEVGNLKDSRLLGSPPSRSLNAPPQREVFISYAWDKGESEEIANTIDRYFQSQGITPIRDIRDLKLGDSARAFMDWMGRGKCIITVMSDRYLKSRNCMYELVQISENAEGNEAFRDRIFPVVLSSAKIYQPRDRIQYIKHWQEERKALEAEMRELDALDNLSELQKDLDFYAKARSTIDTLAKTLSDMKSTNLDMERGATLEDCLSELLDAVAQKMDQ
jgi:internalin A